VSSRIDAAGQPGDDRKAGSTKSARQFAGETHAGGGRVARADDCDYGLGQHSALAANGQERRCVVGLAQARGIFGLAEGDQTDADLGRGGNLGLGLGAGGDPQAAPAAEAG
jgi:hypothetical protein